MKYLVNWNDGAVHSAIMTIAGIHRLMGAAYNEKRNLQVCVWKLAEDSIYDSPTPMRVWYDWKYDNLTLFSLSGDLVELSEHKNSAVSQEKAA